MDRFRLHSRRLFNVLVENSRPAKENNQNTLFNKRLPVVPLFLFVVNVSHLVPLHTHFLPVISHEFLVIETLLYVLFLKGN